jgi:hypothetical protein
MIISECAAAGVILRRPSQGRLRPILTRGEPPRELLERLRANHAAVALHLETLFAAAEDLFTDEREGQGESETC